MFLATRPYCLRWFFRGYGNRSMILLFLCFLISETAAAQYKTDRWTSDNGLPSNAIFKIYESSSGYIWMGTDNGISIFDGHTFRNYSTANSEAFRSNQIQAIYEDRNGDIWLGATNGGLVQYRNREFTRPFGEQDDINQNILSIAEDAQGNLLAGTDGGGLVRISGDSLDFFTTDSGLLSNHISSLHKAADGTVYAGSILGGLSIFLPDTIVNYGIPEGFPQTFVTSVKPGRGEEIWLGTNNGLFLYKNSAFTRHDFSLFGAGSRVVRDILADSDGNLWVGTQSGLFRRARNSGEFVPVEGFDNEFVSEILEDRESNVWVSSYPSGVQRLRKTVFQTLTELDAEQDGPVVSFVETGNGEEWIAARKKVFRKTREGIQTYTFGTGDAPEQIFTLFKDSGKRLWLVTNQAFYRFEGDDFFNIPVPFDSAILRDMNTIFERENGFICAGAAGGGVPCFHAEDVNRTARITGLSNPRVRAFAEANDGTLWVGTDYGLNKVQADSVVTQFTEVLQHAIIRAIHVDPDHTVWFGTHGGGLYRYKDGDFFRFSFEEGLETDIIYFMIKDDYQYFWLTGPTGIYRASAASLNDYADGESGLIDWIFFETEDGLLSSEISGRPFKRGADGSICFPLIGGISCVDPLQRFRITKPPLIHIEDVFIDYKAVSVNRDQGIILEPHELSLEIGYSGISLGFPERVRYRYMLEGFDAGWNHVEDRRFAFYTNLGPGRYTFRVMAQNRDGTWSEEEASVPVLVKAAFYETPLFKAALAVLIVIFLWSLYQYRMINLRKVERVKAQIALDLHDEIGSNLGSIALRSRFLSRQAAISSEEKENLLEIDRISRETAEAMRDIIWLINPERDKLEDLSDKIQQTAATLLGEIPYTFKAETADGKVTVSLALRRNLTLILKEALHNIIRHSDAAAVAITLNTSKNNLQLTIEDNGTGFDPGKAVHGGGLGLKGMKQRAQALKGRFSFISAPGKGTTITISVPLT